MDIGPRNSELVFRARSPIAPQSPNARLEPYADNRSTIAFVCPGFGGSSTCVHGSELVFPPTPRVRYELDGIERIGPRVRDEFGVGSRAIPRVRYEFERSRPHVRDEFRRSLGTDPVCDMNWINYHPRLL